jgi:hypothetical protein
MLLTQLAKIAVAAVRTPTQKVSPATCRVCPDSGQVNSFASVADA